MWERKAHSSYKSNMPLQSDNLSWSWTAIESLDEQCTLPSAENVIHTCEWVAIYLPTCLQQAHALFVAFAELCACPLCYALEAHRSGGDIGDSQCPEINATMCFQSLHSIVSAKRLENNVLKSEYADCVHHNFSFDISCDNFVQTSLRCLHSTARV